MSDEGELIWDDESKALVFKTYTEPVIQANKACWKDCFPTRGAARKEANRRGRLLYPYLCTFCGEWHLTSTKPPSKAAIAKDKLRGGG